MTATEPAQHSLGRPHVGVISDGPLQRHILQSVLTNYGLNIAVMCGPERLSDQLDERMNKVECWIMEIEDETQDHEALETLIAETETPILFGLGNAPQKDDERYISWERRLLSKLNEHLGVVEITDTEEAIIALDREDSAQETTRAQPLLNQNKVSAKNIWVLAASLGGPAAVKEFLDEMPRTIRAGFLYAQHIDPHFSKVLTNVLGRHSDLDLKPIQSGDQIYDGDVLVVPVDREIQFSDQGIHLTQNEWDGPYGPSIDHLLANLVKYYGPNCHVIVFSGMGNDGAMTAPQMKRAGCQIWAQTPDSCANGSMPQSIVDLQCNHRIGTPKELARAFIDYVGCHPSDPMENEDAPANSSDNSDIPDIS